MINQQRRAMKSQKMHNLSSGNQGANSTGSANQNMTGTANSVQGGVPSTGGHTKGLNRAAQNKLNSTGGSTSGSSTAASTTGGASKTTGKGTTSITTPTSTTKSVAHSGTAKTHPQGLAKANTHVRELRGWWWGWPSATHYTYAHLTSLHTQLNHIANTRSATPTNINNLSTALHHVIWNSPSQNSTAVRQLASDVAVGLASRGNSTVNTRDLALHLRAVMNGPRLYPGELETSLTAERSILGSASVAAPHIDSVVGDSQAIATLSY
jgi:hypothetical protein